MTVRRSVPVILAVAAALGGCGGNGDYGGLATVPGPVPAGVTFDVPTTDAPAAPDFTVALVDGNRLTASTLWRERPTVLVFTASWCEACRDLHREVADVVSAHDDAVALLAVMGDEEVEAAQAYAQELRLEHPVARDSSGKVWHDFAVREPPLVALVAPGGGLVRGWPGGLDPGVLANELNALVAPSAP